MSYSLASFLYKLIAIIWSLTIGRSILIMLGGKNIFIKASKDEKGAYYPIINLFTVLEISEISSFFGILFFVPVINLIVLMAMSWKLGKVFNTSTGFKIGLMLLPIVFYPLLFVSDNQYKMGDGDYYKMLDNAHNETTNLMTQEEIERLNTDNSSDSNVEVDSIFKGKIQQIEQISPYKASKIDINALNKLKESSVEDDTFSPIKRMDDMYNEPNHGPVNNVNTGQNSSQTTNNNQ